MKTFKNPAEVKEWIATQSKNYSCRNAFLASEEYANAYEEISKIYKAYNENVVAENLSKQTDYMQKSGLKVGDKVSKVVCSAFMMTTELHGTIVSYGGEIKVKLTDFSKQLAKRRYIAVKGFELENETL